MDEYISTAILGSYEAEALILVEKLDGSCRHVSHRPLLAITALITPASERWSSAGDKTSSSLKTRRSQTMRDISIANSISRSTGPDARVLEQTLIGAHPGTLMLQQVASVQFLPFPHRHCGSWRAAGFVSRTGQPRRCGVSQPFKRNRIWIGVNGPSLGKRRRRPLGEAKAAPKETLVKRRILGFPMLHVVLPFRHLL